MEEIIVIALAIQFICLAVQIFCAIKVVQITKTIDKLDNSSIECYLEYKERNEKKVKIYQTFNNILCVINVCCMVFILAH